ncbi:unnamed protein product [Trichogramma brassicae]|uniref:Uncharacterized protein n=1 Tax=Trichogramma brassicae TaxID=86971 RepID=A0A6H5I8K0_9HYME|nr:unnamed protein product [Trichogramma brassicae]
MFLDTLDELRLVVAGFGGKRTIRFASTAGSRAMQISRQLFPNMDEYPPIRYPEVDQQQNNLDCGVFAIAFATSSLNVHTDGSLVFKSSTYSIWPIQLSINEVPAEVRQKNTITWALWFGPHRNNTRILIRSCRDTLHRGLVHESSLLRSHRDSNELAPDEIEFRRRPVERALLVYETVSLGKRIRVEDEK